MKKVLIFTGLLCLSGMEAFGQISTGDLQFWNPAGKAGLNTFETGKEDTVPYQGLQVRVGGAFTIQFQALDHENAAVPRYAPDDVDEEVNLNQLYDLGPGFNLATANLNLEAQLEDGIRLELVTYLSSRHHPEAWVKGGYLQFDKMLFLNSGLVDNIMEYVTVKVGHMEINYGDAHFRRTDNGNSFKNPFVGNYIMDAFATEMGGEVYFNYKGFLAMAGVTSGQITGSVQRNPGGRDPAFLGKLGYDGQINDDLRLRLTGSVYAIDNAARSTLYSGDRAGSRYYNVMDNEAVNSFTNGRYNPEFSKHITAMVLNPFLKFHGLEFFGNFETATGFGTGESSDRTWNQMGVDLLYRFGAKEKFYIGGRYNSAYGEMKGTGDAVTINRFAGGMGYFIGNNILCKAEYVNQEYDGFAETNILHGGRFNGLVLEGSIFF
ncbi:MAG: hypothetical protein WD077_09440 [Bacteroidia bacterium]